MGWITDVHFPDGVEMNGTKIRPGMRTQVRWDFGVGDVVIDKEGKIVADKVLHMYPLHDDEARAYEKQLATWTGIFDTNMGVLFFKEGQLCHLDLSYKGVGEWLINREERVAYSWTPAPKESRVELPMSVEAFAQNEVFINQFRERLGDNVVPFDAGYSFNIACRKYRERSGELTDPYYKEPTPNGFIRS